MSRRETWYFTFGIGINQPHRKEYVRIEDATREQARLRMIERFGREWAFQYNERGWVGDDGVSQAERYHLTELPL